MDYRFVDRGARVVAVAKNVDDFGGRLTGSVANAGAMERLATELRAYVKANPNLDSAAKLPRIHGVCSSAARLAR